MIMHALEEDEFCSFSHVNNKSKKITSIRECRSTMLAENVSPNKLLNSNNLDSNDNGKLNTKDDFQLAARYDF